MRPLRLLAPPLALLALACGDDRLQQSKDYAISVEKKGAGKVTSRPAGIDCGTSCQAVFSSGAALELIATPDFPEGFAGWSGPCTGQGPCRFTVADNVTVSAIFRNPLNVQKEGVGNVSVSPTGAACGGECVGLFDPTVTVALAASPGQGWRFDHWEGACTGSAPCRIEMTEPRLVKAVFVQSSASDHQLVVNLVGSGSGKVTSGPPGIDCPSGCNAAFPANTTVTLGASADNGSEFTGWSGACSGTGPTCDVTMDAAKSVTARFEQPSVCGWANAFGGPGFDRATSVDVDSQGRILVHGVVGGRVNLGGGPLDVVDNPARGAMFLAVYDDDGTTLAAFGKSSTSAVMSPGQAVWTPDGEIVVGAAFDGSADFGDGTRNDNVSLFAGWRGYLARYQVSGSLRWFQPLGAMTSQFDRGVGVAISPAGDVAATGEFGEPETFGGSQTLTPVGFDAFVAHYSSSGTFGWAKRFGAAEDEVGHGIAYGSQLVVSGAASVGTDFGGGAIASGTYGQAYAASFAPAGTFNWQQTFGTPTGSDAGRAVALFPDGDVLLVGQFEGTASFGTQSLTSKGGADGFVARLGPNGQVKWAKAFGGASYDEVHSGAVDASGNVAVIGVFAGSVDFGTGAQSSKGGFDVFVVKLDENGTVGWVKTFGSANTTYADQAGGVAFDRSGNVVVVGSHEGAMQLNGTTLNSAGYSDIFLACLPK